MGESLEQATNWFKISQYHNQDLQRKIRSLESELEKYKIYETQIKEKDNIIKKLQKKLNATQPKENDTKKKDKQIEELEEMNNMLSTKVKDYASACLILQNENKELQKKCDSFQISKRCLDSLVEIRLHGDNKK